MRKAKDEHAVEDGEFHKYPDASGKGEQKAKWQLQLLLLILRMRIGIQQPPLLALPYILAHPNDVLSGQLSVRTRPHITSHIAHLTSPAGQTICVKLFFYASSS